MPCAVTQYDRWPLWHGCRQLIPVADLPKVMLCDACGAIALQISLTLQAADKRTKRNKQLGEIELLEVLESVCAGDLVVSDPTAADAGPTHWDEYGVADLNASCASPPQISCWNSTKRLVGPGCAKMYEWKREKEPRFGWLGTRINVECERLVSDYNDGDGEMALYKMIRGTQYNSTIVAQRLCADDCARAAAEQVREVQSKYVDEYRKYTKRAKWTEEEGCDVQPPCCKGWLTAA